MKKLLALASLVLVTPGYAQSSSAPASAEATAAITALRTGLTESFVKGDIDKLLAYLDPEVVVTWQNGDVCVGRDAVRAYHLRMMTGEKRIVREVKAEPEVIGRHVYGDWAVSWGNLHDRFTLMDGSDLPFNTLFTATIAKRGDRWLVTGFHASVNAFDNSVLKLAIKKTGLWTGLGAGVLGLLLGFVGARALARRSMSAA
jgi:ketosteroid isomerase-like protein